MLYGGGISNFELDCTLLRLSGAVMCQLKFDTQVNKNSVLNGYAQRSTLTNLLVSTFFHLKLLNVNIFQTA